MKHFKQFKLTLITLIFLLTTALATVQAKPPTFESLVKKANTQYNAGKYDEAINTYNQAYQMKNMAAILYNLGRSYEAKADFNTAIKYYSQFAQSPDIEYDARVEALDRIKTLQEVQNLATSPKPKSTNTPKSSTTPSPTGCVDPNTATLEQLQTLPTIGEATAKNIIESRNTQGPFNSPQDLTRVKRIGEKTVEKILPQLCPFNNNNPKTPQPPKTATNPTPKKESAVKNPPKNTTKPQNTGDQWNL